MDYPPINIRAFSLTFWVFWSIWNDKTKIENNKKMKFAIEMLTFHVDGQGYVHSVHPPPALCAQGVEPLTKFSKKGSGLTGPQLLEGCC